MKTEEKMKIVANMLNCYLNETNLTENEIQEVNKLYDDIEKSFIKRNI